MYAHSKKRSCSKSTLILEQDFIWSLRWLILRRRMSNNSFMIDLIRMRLFAVFHSPIYNTSNHPDWQCRCDAYRCWTLLHFCKIELFWGNFMFRLAVRWSQWHKHWMTYDNILKFCILWIFLQLFFFLLNNLNWFFFFSKCGNDMIKCGK